MKHLLLTTIAAVLVVGCGEAQSPETPTSKLYFHVGRGNIPGNIEAVKKAIADGADVNAKYRGYAPLHWAETKETAELLIAKGADVNAQMDDGRTSLDWAIQLKRTKTADLLRKHGGKTAKELKAEGK